MTVLVCADRDDTINKDNNYFLGSDPNWKDQVEILPTVVEGIRAINSIPDSHFFIITNQSGVALQGGDFDNLTLERMHEVNRYIIEQLEEQGLKIDGYRACPYIDTAYAEKSKKRGRIVNPEFIHDGHPNRKPNPGMLENILASLKLTATDCDLFLIGDRASDVQTALNMGGTGILVPGTKTRELKDLEKIADLKGKVLIAENFLQAANYIKEQTYL